MLRTILLLLVALIVIPLVAYTRDAPLDPGQAHTLWQLIRAMLVVALLCFVVSEWTGNYSQVDKLWSLLPIGYTAWVAWAAGGSPRLVLMAALVAIWGIRLTANFARRGGYSRKWWTGEEDYRWAELRKKPLLAARWRFTLFNFFFISLYQNSLILLFSLPILVAWQGQHTPLGWLDGLAALLMLGFIAMETIADNQQYRFQTEKYRRIQSGEPLTGSYADGFCQSGLWACLRHPNYTAEQAIWLSFYLFGVAATGRWFNWSLAGPVLLLLLFQGSADFSESISANKYKAYAAYQRRVGRFLPRLR